MQSGELTYFKRGARILNDHFVIDPNEFPLWNLSYSMQGEDLILRNMMKTKLRSGALGFYVDLGSYDCRYGSNSYLFYQYGWRGICVEVNPTLAPHYAVLRPRDVFINSAVGEAGVGYWAEENSSAACGRVARSAADFGPDFKTPIEIKFLPLKAILDQHVPQDTVIDFMSIDVEGSEMSVLLSSDWSRYRPRIIVIEVNDLNIMNFREAETLSFLLDHDYKIEGVSFPNVVLSAR